MELRWLMIVSKLSQNGSATNHNLNQFENVPRWNDHWVGYKLLAIRPQEMWRLLCRARITDSLQKWPNYEAGFLIIMMGQNILFLKCKVSYFLFNNSLTPHTDACSYYNESLQIVFWIFQFTGHDFPNYTILEVRTPDFQPYRLYCYTI